MNRTDLFLLRIDDFSRAPIPDPVRLRFKLALLDYIGVTFAGVKAQDAKLSEMISETDDGKSPVIGVNKELSLENAVFYNGLNAHALDFDDGTNAGIIHLGSPVFSVLLPVAERYHIPVEKFIAASIVGYETSFTMAMSIQPKHKELGYHATGTCGTLGIALAVSEALDFTDTQRRDAFSVAAVSATGTLKVLEEGSELKPYNVAKTALMGYTAAKVGKAGYAGPDDVLSGDRGFLKMMHGDDAVELKSPLLDGTYAIEKAYIKPYAACRYCHPSIEAALTIRRNDLRSTRNCSNAVAASTRRPSPVARRYSSREAFAERATSASVRVATGTPVARVSARDTSNGTPVATSMSSAIVAYCSRAMRRL